MIASYSHQHPKYPYFRCLQLKILFLKKKCRMVTKLLNLYCKVYSFILEKIYRLLCTISTKIDGLTERLERLESNHYSPKKTNKAIVCIGNDEGYEDFIRRLKGDVVSILLYLRFSDQR